MGTRFAILLAIIALPGIARAQSTAFTYQGHLSSGSAASGLHDLRFKLFDSVSGGAQIGATQCIDNVRVADGLFTTTIDFGQQFASTSSRFLEIEVRPDTGLDCSNTTGFTLLTPRQPLSPSPIVNHANAAFALDAPDGAPANAVFVDNAGKVGIGTTAPTHSVHIAAPEPTLALQDTDSSSSQVGYISYRDSSNIERAWIGYGSPGSPDLSMLNARPSGNMAFWTTGVMRFITNGGERVSISPTGNVGIGTPSPASTLDVRGDIRLGSAGQLKSLAGEENLRIVRGIVLSNGQIAQGTGFSCSFNASTTTYIIVFDTPFSAPPVVVVTPDQTGLFDISAQIVLNTLTNNSVRIAIFERSDGRYDISKFHLMAIGPR